jgi:outer membrane protein TolC
MSWNAGGTAAIVVFIVGLVSDGLAEEAGKKVYPIDLPTVLQLTGAQNLDIQIARERLAEAKANHESARERFFPWLNVGATYRRHDNRLQDVEGRILDVNKQSYTAGATLTAQVDLGDAIYQTLAAHQLVRVAGHAFEAQRQDSLLAAAQGYFDLAKAQATVGVAREAVRISQDYQNQLHQAVTIGIAFKGDELRVRVETERNQLALRQALEQARIAAARLSQILHLDATVELIARESDLAPLAIVKNDSAIEMLVAQAITSRPELKQNQALVVAAHKTKEGTIYGPLIPTLGVQVFAGGLGGGVGGATGNFGESEDYVAGLSWRIGPGGLLDFGRIHASESRLRGAQLFGEKLKDEITRQVVESHTRVRSLADQFTTTKLALGTAEEAFRLTRARKEFAVGNVLENIQAEQELTRVRTDYFNVVAEYDKAQYVLERAVGALPSSLSNQDEESTLLDKQINQGAK